MLSHTAAPDAACGGGSAGGAFCAAGEGGGLTKSGAGTLILSGPNTYTGITTVSQGILKLAIGGSLSSSTEIKLAGGILDGSASGIIIPPTQTLDGNGGVVGNTTVNGTVAPGNSIGVITVAGNVTLAGTATMEIDRTGAPISDELNVITPGTTITYGGTLNVTLFGGTLQLGDTFDLFDATSFPGSFATINTPNVSGYAPGNWYLKTSDLNVNGSIQLLPEPSTSLMAGLAASSLLLRRRRK